MPEDKWLTAGRVPLYLAHYRVSLLSVTQAGTLRASYVYVPSYTRLYRQRDRQTCVYISIFTDTRIPLRLLSRVSYKARDCEKRLPPTQVL